MNLLSYPRRNRHWRWLLKILVLLNWGIALPHGLAINPVQVTSGRFFTPAIPAVTGQNPVVRADSVVTDTTRTLPPELPTDAGLIPRVRADSSVTTGRLTPAPLTILPPILTGLGADTTFTNPTHWRRRELELTLYRHAGDWVQNLTGIALNDFVSTGLPAFCRIRGSGLNQPIIFIDDVPLNHAQFGAFDLSLLPAAVFESVAVNFASTRNGVATPVGSINFVSRTYSLKEPFSKILWHKGSHGDSEVNVTFGRRITPNTEAIADVNYQSSDGRFQHSQYAAQKMRLQVDSHPTPAWQTTYQLFFHRHDLDFPSPALAPVSWQPYTAHQKIDLYQHFLTARGNLPGDSQTDLKVQTYFQSQYREFKDLPNELNGIYRNRFWGAHGEIHLPVAARLLTVGVNYEARWLRSNELKSMTFHEGALYVEQTFAWSPRLQFQILPRLELNHHFGLALLPDLGLRFQPNPDFQLGLNFQAARQLPNFFELYWHHKYFQGNSQLNPATLQTLALDFHYQPAAWVRWAHTAFLRRVYSAIEMTRSPDSTQLTFLNQRVAYFYGAEQQLEVHLGRSLDWRWSFNLLFTRDEHQKSLPDRPWLTTWSDITYRRHFFEGSLRTRFYARFNLLGKRWSLWPDTTYPFPGYFYSLERVALGWEPTLDLKAEGTIGALQLFFSIENLLARRYQVITGYNRREFAIFWGLEWQFWN